MFGRKVRPRDDYNYLFIVTYGRSGSTILARLLNEDPTFLIRGENRNALRYLVRSMLLARSVAPTKSVFGDNVDDPWYGASSIQIRDYQTALVNAFVAHVLAPKPRTRTIGFKEIRFGPPPRGMDDTEFDRYIETVLEVFPGSRIIFNIRPWEQVAKSAWYARSAPESVREFITTCDDRFMRAAERFPARTRVFSYENLKPSDEKLLELLSFAGSSLGASDIERVLSREVSVPRSRKFRNSLRKMGI